MLSSWKGICSQPRESSLKGANFGGISVFLMATVVDVVRTIPLALFCLFWCICIQFLPLRWCSAFSINIHSHGLKIFCCLLRGLRGVDSSRCFFRQHSAHLGICPFVFYVVTDGFCNQQFSSLNGLGRFHHLARCAWAVASVASINGKASWSFL